MGLEKHFRHRAIALLLFGAAAPAAAQTGIGVKVGSLGIGPEFTKSLKRDVNLRLGANFFNHGYAGTEDDVEYDFKLKLKSATGLIDLHPGGGSFRVSGGLVVNDNALDAVGVPTGTYRIGNTTYTGAQVGTLTGRVDFRRTSPYGGIGFGNMAKGSGPGFFLDLGVVFQGSPRVTLTASGPAAGAPQFQEDLRREETNLRNDLKVFKYYPVVALGVVVKF